MLALVETMAAGQTSDPGEGGDFGEVAEIHRSMLLRVALRLAGEPELAKDLVQETLLRGWRRFDRIQHGAHAGAWLVTILTNLFYDYLKHQKVVTRAASDLASGSEHEPGLDSILLSIGDAELHAAVRALEPELREVVELCYLEQMSYRDAAAILNQPMGTIGSRLSRARVRLRALLDPSALTSV
jgi:RNA polymerase sigma-70 factor (ECF subfamily)